MTTDSQPTAERPRRCTNGGDCEVHPEVQGLHDFDNPRNVTHHEPEETQMTTSTETPFKAAKRLAPQPESRTAPVSDWARHFAAHALAAHAEFREQLFGLPPNPGPGSRPELGYLSAMAISSTAAAAALMTSDAPSLLWDLTPELGALNGEYVDWLADMLAGLGVNPAHIYRWYDEADFAITALPAEPVTR